MKKKIKKEKIKKDKKIWKKGNSIRRNWKLEQLPQASSFSHFRLSQTQSIRTPLVPYHLLYCTCVTYRMQRHVIGHDVLPTKPLPRDAEGFPRDRKYPKVLPLSTYLDYLQPIYLIILDWFEEISKLAV